MSIRSKCGNAGVLARLAALLLLGIGLLGLGTANAGLFIQFEGIKGESTDKNHKDWSVIDSVNWGVSTSVTCIGTRCTAGAPSFSDLSWTQVMDKSFPPLFTAISTGDTIGTATVDFTTFVEGVNVVYFQMIFDTVALTGLNLNGSSSGKASVDGSFAYRKIRMEYRELDSKGGTKSRTSAEYDLSKGGGKAAALLAVYELGMSGPTLVPIPEPEIFGLLLLGLGPLALAAYRRKRNAA